MNTSGPIEEKARKVTTWALGALLVIGAAGLVVLALQPDMQTRRRT